MKKGWETKKLGECFRLKSGAALTSNEMEEGIIPVFGGNGIAGYHSEFNLSGNNVVIGRVGALCGKSRNIKENIWLTDNAFQVVDFRVEFDLAFLNYLLNFYNLRQYARQAAQPVISNSSLRDIILTFPKSILEQKRIAVILDEAFASIAKAKANAEHNLKNARELFESYLQSVFANKGEGWEVTKLKEVCEYDKNQNSHKNLPYVGLEHIESNTGTFLGSYEPQEVKSATFQFNEQHVLYGRLRPYLNKVLLPNFNGHCSTEIFPIKVKKQIIRDFLFYWLIAGTTVKKIDATWTGARMPRANMNQVLEFDFVFPSINEQVIIVRKLKVIQNEIHRLEAIYKKKIDNLEELKRSILQKAFNGE